MENKIFETKEDCVDHFKANYNNPSHPIAFSGINNVYRFYGGQLGIRDIKDLLSSNESYTLRREFKKKNRNPSYTHYKRYQFQIDLVDISQLYKWNDGVKYIFACIDTFTRKVWVKPCKDKSAKTVLQAFREIISDVGKLPYCVLSDRGKEMDNKFVIAFCKKNKIKYMHNFTSVHCAYIERFFRTFQNMIYKYLSQLETRRYIDKLQDFAISYNNKYHRMIGMTPEEAEKDENHEAVALKMSKYHAEIKKVKPKYGIDQLVRIALQKGPFHRGYNEQSNEEVFRINSIKTTLPLPLYLLETYDKKEKLIGFFYENEITPVNSDIFRISKVIKEKTVKGKKQYFVKWRGYDNSYNSWVDADDITENFNNGGGE